MVSSHMPCWSRRGFEDWAACEDFLGFSVPNPLEACDWLEKGTSAAMPLGFRDAPRVDIQWNGTEEGYVDWISIDAGYLSGPTGVTLSALLYGDPAKAKFSDRDWTLDLGKQDIPADGVLHVISEAAERYSSRTAYLVRDGVLYCVHVVGEPDGTAEVEETLERALAGRTTEPDLRFAQNLLAGKYGFLCQYDPASGCDTLWSVLYDLGGKALWRAEGNPSRRRFEQDVRFSIT